MNIPTYAERIAYIHSPTFLTNGFPNGSMASSYGFISKLGNWTKFPSFDPAVVEIQELLETPFDRPSYYNNLTVPLYEQSTLYPNITDLCTSVIHSNMYRWNLKRDFRSNNVFKVCTMYPNLTRALDSGAISTEPGQLGADLMAFGIMPGDTKAANNLTNMLTYFMTTACDGIYCDQEQSQGGQVSTKVCQSDMLLIDGGSNSTNGANVLLNNAVDTCRAAICAAAIQLFVTNTDIGGIGVWISYIIQLSIHIIFGLHIMYQWFLSHYFIVKHRGKISVHYYKHTLVVKPASMAFRDSCSNFQVAQAWFLISLIIAATIEISNNLGSALDYFLLRCLSCLGAILLVFTMLFCVYYETGSWYVMMVTSVAYVCCSVYYWMMERGFGPTYSSHAGSGVGLCYFELLQYQSDQLLFRTMTTLINGLTESILKFAWIFSFMVFVWVVLRKTWPSLKATRVGNWYVVRRANELGKGRTWIVKRLFQFILGNLALFVFGYQFFLLIAFYSAVKDQWSNGDGWRFGQVMAAMAWLPAVIEYAWLRVAMRGEEGGSGRRESQLIIQSEEAHVESSKKESLHQSHRAD